MSRKKMSKDKESQVEFSGAEKIIESFKRHNIDRVFVFPGGTIGPILHLVENPSINIEIICPRNEQGAGYAALAHAKLTGKPAVYMVTSGPGVTNAVTPIADAYFDNIPLVVLTGQVGTDDMRGALPVKQRGFQEVDTVDLVRPITKAAFLARATKDIPDLMENAFHMAGSGRKGPVLVDLPMNVQRTSIPVTDFSAIQKRTWRAPLAQQRTIDTLARWILKAKRPVLLGGGGTIDSNAQDELRALADTQRIPVAVSLPAVGIYPTKKELSLGLCGYAGSQYCNTAIYNADLLIGIGTTFHLRQTGSMPEKTSPNASIARIDIDKNELQFSRVPIDLSIHGDAKVILARLVDALEGRSPQKKDAWLEQIDQWKEKFALTFDRKKKLKPQLIIEIADRLVQASNVIVATGVGQHQIWVARHFNFDYPSRQLLTSSGHGTMGFDLPTAIGAKISNPKATVLCFVGDGSLQMNIQELATIAERKLDVKIIVLDNKSLNIVAQFQRENWKTDPATGNKYNPDFAQIAKAYGIKSFSISSPQEAEKILSIALKSKEAALVHCHVDPREDLLPMLLGGHTLDDMNFDSSF